MYIPQEECVWQYVCQTSYNLHIRSYSFRGLSLSYDSKSFCYQKGNQTSRFLTAKGKLIKGERPFSRVMRECDNFQQLMLYMEQLARAYLGRFPRFSSITRYYLLAGEESKNYFCQEKCPLTRFCDIYSQLGELEQKLDPEGA